MIEPIKQHHAEIAELCRRFDVRLLELFGSAARGDFRPGTSDLDFLVLFRSRGGQISAADRYFGLLFELELLFKRKIDLIDIRGARNPYFLAEALRHRVMLYAA